MRSNTLNDLFPGLAVQKQKMSLADAWSTQGRNFQLRRNFNDREIARWTEFFKMLEEFKGTQEGANKLCWNEDSKGMFKVNSATSF